MKDFCFFQKQVEDLSDGLGKGIDENIKFAVAAFRFAGFDTSMSCEGHANKKWGYPFPWIDIADLNSITRMKFFILKYYSNKEMDLCSLKLQIYKDSYRVQSCVNLNVEILKGISFLHRDAEMLLHLQNIMNDFAKFLIVQRNIPLKLVKKY